VKGKERKKKKKKQCHRVSLDGTKCIKFRSSVGPLGECIVGSLFVQLRNLTEAKGSGFAKYRYSTFHAGGFPSFICRYESGLFSAQCLLGFIRR
jgi:hypothetical protein